MVSPDRVKVDCFGEFVLGNDPEVNLVNANQLDRFLRGAREQTQVGERVFLTKAPYDVRQEVTQNRILR